MSIEQVIDLKTLHAQRKLQKNPVKVKRKEKIKALGETEVETVIQL